MAQVFTKEIDGVVHVSNYIDGTGWEEWVDHADGYVNSVLSGYSSTKIAIDLYNNEFILPEVSDYMFAGITNTTLDATKWNTSGVVSMEGLFLGSDLESADLSGWDVRLTRSMKWMFRECNKLKYLNLRGWELHSLSNADGMFIYCIKLETIDTLPNTDWKSYHRLYKDNTLYMFGGCDSLPYRPADWDDIERDHSAKANNIDGFFKHYPQTFTVRWMSEDGKTVYETQEWEKGTTPAYTGYPPTKPSSGGYNYIFAGWDPIPVPIQEATDFLATFTAVPDAVYTITFEDELTGKVWQTSQVKHGDTPVYTGETPTVEHEQDIWHTYTFTGWDPAIVPATANATYKAVWNIQDAYYNVKYYNWDKSTVLYQVNNVKAGTVVEYPNDPPARPSSVVYDYTFKYFEDQYGTVDGSSVFNNSDFVAQYDGTIRSYKTSYDMGGHGDQISPRTRQYGTPLPKPDTPRIENDTYVFDKWYNEDTHKNEIDFENEYVTGERTIYGKWLTWEESGNCSYIKIDGTWYKIDTFREKTGRVI